MGTTGTGTSNGEVDATKVTREGKITLLAAIDNSPATTPVLIKTAEIARRSSAQVIVLHILQDNHQTYLQSLKEKQVQN